MHNAQFTMHNRDRRYGPRASALGTSELATTAEAVAPYGGKPPTKTNLIARPRHIAEEESETAH